MSSYVLIVVAYVYSGVNVSQQEYRGLDACETAAATVVAMTTSVRGPGAIIQTKCVSKTGEH